MTHAPFAPAKPATDAADELRAIFPPGSTARTILRHVSKSGMTRWISVMDADGESVTWLVAAAMGEKIHERGGHHTIKVTGCGMDQGFSLVYNLAAVLYRDGYPCQIVDGVTAPDEGYHCPSNHHVNAGDWSHLDTPHTDGYAVSQRWM